MSITRLQQARQMYALGQLVSKTMDGSRPGYRGDDAYGGGSGGGGNQGGGNGGEVDTGDLGTEAANVEANVNANMDSRDRARMNQYTNVPTATVTIGVDKFDNPIKVNTTYTDRRTRQKTLDALNAKGISSFDPRVTKAGINFLDPSNLVTSFAPQQKSFGLLDLALMAATGGLLGGKAKTVAGLYSKGKFALDKSKQIGSLLETIGLTDTNVIDSFTDSFSDKFSGFDKGKKSTTKSTTKNNTINNGGKGDGDGIASLDNQASGYDEYILLLQKLQSGNISDSERNRFNVLKNMLGI